MSETSGKNTVYSRSRTGFSGVDMREDPGGRKKSFVQIENMYRDYGSGGTDAETIPGFRKLFAFGARINGIFFYTVENRRAAVVHAGKNLYRFFTGEKDDSRKEPEKVTENMADTESRAFVFGEDLYLLDGNGYYVLHADGSFSSVAANAYVPLLYLNGQMYEQENLLTDKAEAQYIFGDLSSYAAYSAGFSYTVNEDGKSCTLTETADTGTAAIRIPRETTIRGREYTVTAIGEDAFRSAKMQTLILPDTLTSIGDSAFQNCVCLKRLILPDNVREIGDFAFMNCTGLSYIYMAKNVTKIGTGAFAGCHAVTGVDYGGLKEGLDDVTDHVASSFTPASFKDLTEKAGVTFRDGCTAPTEKGGVYRFPIGGYVRALLNVSFENVAIGATTSPVFSPDSDNILSAGAVIAAVKNKYPAQLKLLPANDGSFTVWGNADYDDELAISTLTECTGYFRLSGAPKGTGCGLKAEYRDTAGKLLHTASDTGDGAVIGPLSGNGSLTVYFYATEGAVPDHVQFVPKLQAADGMATYRPVYGNRDGDGVVSACEIAVTDAEKLAGGRLSLRLQLYSNARGSFRENTGFRGARRAAIEKATIGVMFDGRPFFTGNPALPETVFYASRNRDGVIDPAYCGANNYFSENGAGGKITAMLPASGSLFVFKEDATGDFLYCHTGNDVADDLCPRIYPVTAGGFGVSHVYAAMNFAGDAVFASATGLYGIGNATAAGERAVYRRSARVEKWFRERRGKKVSAAVASGYLFLSFGDGEVLLADGHGSDSDGYDFYRLTGIGTYSGEKTRYEYAASLPAACTGYVLSEKTGMRVEGDVLTDGGYHYVTEGEKRVLCTTRGETEGGVFSPAAVFASDRNQVYFGTADGNLCCFNTDKRGEDGRIPPEWYTFAGRRYRSGCTMPFDDEGVPYLMKKTVHRSTVLKLTRFSGGRLYVGIRESDRDNGVTDTLCAAGADFGSWNFSSVSFKNNFTGVYPIKDINKRYAEKQYYFYTDDYRCRFGFCGLSYRYTIGGKIKR